MITDLFITRYPGSHWFGSSVAPDLHRLFTQAAHIMFEDVGTALGLDQAFYKRVHDLLCRELGIVSLNDELQYHNRVARYLLQPFDLWDNGHRTPDYYIKTRLSMVELLFRSAEERLKTLRGRPAKEQAALDAAIQELNSRLRTSGVGLQYHAGTLQEAADELIEQEIAAPCWALLADAKWSNAERELKEALDRAAHGSADAAFHAGKALESTIKVISDEKGWTTGNERGAANYVDNLVSRNNGRFIEPWEAELLKGFFSYVRNPHSHGAGSDPAPQLSDQQRDWAIEAAMSWMKSLIRRL